MPSQWTTVQVDGTQMWAYTSIPDGPGPHPGVTIIHHGYLDEWVQEIAGRVSGAGYAVIAPDLHHRVDADVSDLMGKVQKLDDDNIIKDVNAAIALLRRHPQVRGDRIGIMGFCLGGRITYMMAAANPHLKAAGAFYPGNTMVRWGRGSDSPFDRTADIGCPVIAFFGEDDDNPTGEDMKALDAELTRHGKTHEFHSYPGAGHSFQWNGTDAYRPDAARDSWDKLMGWFQRHLRD